jgi:hypothetical protein
MNATCFGLLGIVMHCQIAGNAPKVIDSTCRDSAYAVGKILSLSDAEMLALPKAQKQANASTVAKYRKRGCMKANGQ